MKKRSAFSLFAAVAGGLLFNFSTTPLMAQDAPKTETAAAAAAGPFKHVVIFGFKEGTSPEKLKEVVDAFRALKGKIPAVLSFEYGRNISPEKLNEELTHVFTLTFKSKEALENEYLHHPEHVKFVELVKPILAKAVVVDYIAE